MATDDSASHGGEAAFRWPGPRARRLKLEGTWRATLRWVDVVELPPASTKGVAPGVDNPGIWMYHCHVNQHIVAGVMARFQVLP
jgi:FtsP/CotA-like multicopper oxidase with cupredoxin domain